MDKVIEQLKEISINHKLEKVVLFGSRARGDNSPVSDYDIGIFAKDITALDKARIYDEIEEINTLKKIDVVFVNDNSVDDLTESIIREGVVIYEQTGNEAK